MTKKYVLVYAPATIANLGSGYDVLGVAIEKPGDIVEAKRTLEPGVHFTLSTIHENVPATSRKNVAAHVAALMLEEFKPPFGIKLTLHKHMPIGSGLGSSAASSVGAVVAVNELLQKKLRRSELLRFAVEGERLASGSPHADNAAPSLFGGVCLVRSYTPLEVVQIPIQKTFFWVVVHPHVIVKTKEARSILPKNVPLASAVRQWGNVSGLTVGLMTGNVALVGKSMEDTLVEPFRAKLIPAFDEVKRAALSHGAAGCSISGSGPSVFALAPSLKQARVIGKAMRDVFQSVAHVESEMYVSATNMNGAYVIDSGKG
ncbi:MAG: homoserine kinase [Bacteroidetes bacterium]|nr:MAG: homoserine kinase [Bacteroidota bacterium]